MHRTQNNLDTYPSRHYLMTSNEYPMTLDLTDLFFCDFLSLSCFSIVFYVHSILTLTLSFHYWWFSPVTSTIKC